ncbi:MAG: hypothetical protein JW744_03940 [Candidatus Diapherotrites archaeon]|uniref:RET cysteine rich domain-containing protein n=1 Tax=Candidatus Iainarchaeum sp. TaxID=3101447 RepID=A0A939C4V4_9ARCH|nr:hypothetical protein [Candidatus Diapherotrites archaeon]
MQKKIIFLAAILAIVLLSGCTEPSRCGDGICDENEQLNPELCPQDCPAEAGIQPYYIAIHCEPAGLNQANYQILKDYIESANAYNIKLTLMFSDTWASYIAASPQRMAELREWERQGHEIAGHHHSIYHGYWDGYTNYTWEEARAKRIEIRGRAEPYLGTLDDFMEKLKQINSGMNSGCMNEEDTMKAIPNEIIYDTCSGFYNFGEPARKYYAGDPELARNEYVTTGIVNGIERKWLTHGQITSVEKQQAVKEIFETANSGTLGAVVHASGNSSQNLLLLDFLDFLHEKDPQGEKSMTLTEIIESGKLPEQNIGRFCGESLC